MTNSACLDIDYDTSWYTLFAKMKTVFSDGNVMIYGFLPNDPSKYINISD